MKVDLVALKRMVETEIERVDKKRVRLLKQLEHINAVEQIALECGSAADSTEEKREDRTNEANVADHHHRWFQQV
jgi:hypothetical protein